MATCAPNGYLCPERLPVPGRYLCPERLPLPTGYLGLDGYECPAHQQDLPFPVAAGWAPAIPGGPSAPEPGAILLGMSDISTADGLDPSSLQRALRVTVYLTDLGQWAAVNEVYESFFSPEPPARVAIGVAALPRGAYVEIDAVVAL